MENHNKANLKQHSIHQNCTFWANEDTLVSAHHMNGHCLIRFSMNSSLVALGLLPWISSVRFSELAAYYTHAQASRRHLTYAATCSIYSDTLFTFVLFYREQNGGVLAASAPAQRGTTRLVQVTFTVFLQTFWFLAVAAFVVNLVAHFGLECVWVLLEDSLDYFFSCGLKFLLICTLLAAAAHAVAAISEAVAVEFQALRFPTVAGGWFLVFLTWLQFDWDIEVSWLEFGQIGERWPLGWRVKAREFIDTQRR